MNQNIKILLLAFSMIIASIRSQSQSELDKISAVAEKFSADFVNGDYASMHDAYWDDAIILPPGRDIIKGKSGIVNYWSFGKDFKQVYHRSIADSIIISGNFAFDYGYWYSQSRRGENTGPLYSGKYIIVWEKRNGAWKMYQDIWNNRSSDWEPRRPEKE